MSYVGGKAKAHFLFDVLNSPRFDGWAYFEPCCGYCHVLRRVVNKRSYAASDSNALLLVLLRAVQDGTPLPEPVSRARYDALRRARELTLETALAAFALSFNGKEFGGYTRTYTRRDGRVDDIFQSRLNYYAKLRASPPFRAARLECTSYQTLPMDTQPADTLVFLDPPYNDCTGYSGPPFDTAAFWDTATRWSRSVVVLVSEYACERPDWVVVHQAPKAVTLSGGAKQTVRLEKLFCHASVLARHQPLRAPPSDRTPCPLPPPTSETATRSNATRTRSSAALSNATRTTRHAHPRTRQRASLTRAAPSGRRRACPRRAQT